MQMGYGMCAACFVVKYFFFIDFKWNCLQITDELGRHVLVADGENGMSKKIL